MTHNSPPDIGRRIKQIRGEKNLTLQELASRSGVSKSMLSQIERGMTNPTLAILWSLTQSLGITIADLVVENNNTSHSNIENIYVDMVKSHHIPEIRSADGKCCLRILGPIDKIAHTEWYDMTLEAGGILDSEGHSKGTVEHLTVLEGSLTVTAGAQKQIVETGDTIRYQADLVHIIENKGKSNARALMVVLSKA